MTREEINNLALSKIDNTKCLILELITGFGKSKLAIDLINHICERVYKNDQCPTKVLLLVSKKVHKQTWRNEINKWGGIKTDYLTIECYDSLKKYKDDWFDIVIADEMQHLSDSRLDILSTIKIQESFIGLSATIKKVMKEYFINNYNADIIKCGLKEAVESEVLPEPLVYLLPLKLDTTQYKYKAKRFNKDIITTQQGCYDCMSSYIKFKKEEYYRSRSIFKQRQWFSAAGNRLKWLSEQKRDIVLALLDKFKNYKTLTFCNNIKQAELLGKHNITSKNKNSAKNLEMFNNNKIKHITSVNILNEGVNLNNCRIGIFCNLNSSEIITKQRIGRLLRHKKPVIILPYYINTREEELVSKMIEEYNKENIIIVNNINDIKL